MGYRRQRTALSTRGRSGNVVRAPSRATHAVELHRGHATLDRGHATLDRVLCDAAPAAALLVSLLAPWDRARLRLACRALADAVPAASCAPSMATMVRARGAGLLRYGAGDARPCWAHVLIAVEADAADALRWLLGSCVQWTGNPERMWLLKRLALRTGSAAAWRIVEPLASRQWPHGLASPVKDACCGGSEPLIAECAAAAAAAIALHSDLLRCSPFGLHRIMCREDLPTMLVPFLRLGTANWYARTAALAALAMGRRDLAEPCDWLTLYAGSRRDLLINALRGGDVALAEAVLRGGAVDDRLMSQEILLECAVRARRNTSAVLEWAMRTSTRAPTVLSRNIDRLQLCAIEADSVDALRWLTERTGHVPTATQLDLACRHGAVKCIGHLGVRPTPDMLREALLRQDDRAVAALARCMPPLDAVEFVRLVAGVSGKKFRGLRAMTVLRRHALLPAPGPAFLVACLDLLCLPAGLGTLAAAGYRVDADERGWLDSVRPHCAGTLRRRWRSLARALRDRWWTQCAHE